jgi:hypothetical protein
MDETEAQKTELLFFDDKPVGFNGDALLSAAGSVKGEPSDGNAVWRRRCGSGLQAILLRLEPAVEMPGDSRQGRRDDEGGNDFMAFPDMLPLPNSRNLP